MVAYKRNDRIVGISCVITYEVTVLQSIAILSLASHEMLCKSSVSITPKTKLSLERRSCLCIAVNDSEENLMYSVKFSLGARNNYNS